MNITRRLTVSLAAILAVFAGFAGGAEKKIRVLVLTGANNHDWKKTTPALRKILEETGRFAVETTKPPAGLDADTLAKYDVILSNWNSWGSDREAAEAWPAAARKAYVNFVRSGGGHVTVHAGGSSFYDGWPAYRKVALVYWEKGRTGHGRRHEFTVRIESVDHPVTAGLDDFTITDELWRNPGVVEGATVLASSRSTHKGKETRHPAVVSSTLEKGRCCGILLGHGVANMTNPGFRALVVRGTAWAAGSAASPADRKGAVRLPVGDGLDGWRGNTGDWVAAGDVFQGPDDPKKLAWKEGTGCLVNGKKGRTRHLVTEREHGDCRAHVEFMVPKGSNSGVYFQGRYEIQVLDSWGVEKLKHGDCGGIYQRWDPKRGRGKQGFEGRSPRINASRPPGRWQEFDVVFRAPRFDEQGRKIKNARFVKVVHNGKVVHENVAVTGPTRAAMFRDEKPRGPMMLQGDHGPVAYRNIIIEPLPRSE